MQLFPAAVGDPLKEVEEVQGANEVVGDRDVCDQDNGEEHDVPEKLHDVIISEVSAV